MEYLPKTIIEYHIFKDVDNTSWKSPQIFTFPLTAESGQFPRWGGDQDGVANLHHLSQEQLSFLAGHLKAKNDEVKAIRDAAKQMRLKRVAHEVAKHKKYRELQLQAAEEQKAANSKEGEENEDKTAAGWDSDFSSRSPSPAPPPPVVARSRRRNRSRRFRGHHQTWESLPGQIHIEYPPPYGGAYPPQGLPRHLQDEFETLYPPRLSTEALQDMISPVEQGTDWTLEAVGIDLIPDIDNSSPQPVFSDGNPRKNLFGNPRRNPPPAYPQKPAESTKTTFRAFYRRTILTCLAQDDNSFRPVNSRYVDRDSMVGDIVFGDYADPQGESAQIAVEHEGDKVDGGREDDLEIVAQQEADGAEDGGTQCHDLQ